MAAREKVLAKEVNKQRRQVTAAQENALANNAYEQRYQELAKRNAELAESVLAAEWAALSTDLALPLTAVLPTPHCPITYKDAVLSTQGGEPLQEVFSRCTVVSPVNYGWQPTPDGMLLQPTLLPCWPTPWPPGSQSTGAPSLRAATLAPRSQPIYWEWIGLSGGGDFVDSCSLGGTWGILLLLVLLEALGGFCCFLVLLEALFGRQFSW
jgi:hypothetical protein